MKTKTRKQILSVFLVLVMAVSMLPMGGITASAYCSRYDNFNSCNLTGNAASDMVAIARAQLNRTQSGLGYTEAWCADFVQDCAIIAGQTAAIPTGYGLVSDLYTVVKSAGGVDVSSPQAGDLVFYYCNNTSISRHGGFQHVGIVSDSNGNSIEGNYSSKVSSVSGYYRDAKGCTTNDYISKIYVRPNYTNTGKELATPFVWTDGDIYPASSSTPVTVHWYPVDGATHYWLTGWDSTRQFFTQDVGNVTSYDVIVNTTGPVTFYVTAINDYQESESGYCNITAKAVTSTPTQVASCTYDGHTYKAYFCNKTWGEAKAWCENNGGYLCTIRTEAERLAVKYMLNEEYTAVGNPHLFIGATNTSGSWKWADGTSVDYTHWQKNQPDNSGGIEHYLAIWSNEAEYNDCSDHEQTCYGFIYESSQESTATESTAKPTVSAQGYFLNHGWSNAVSDGSSFGYTQSDYMPNTRMEALKLSLENCTGNISYKVYMPHVGWVDSASQNGAVAGLTDDSEGIEAVQISLSGDVASKYNVYYHAYVFGHGWTGWAMNGESCGTHDSSLPITALKVMLVPKVTYAAHVSDVGWQSNVKDGAVTGTTGQSKAMEAVAISLCDDAYGDISYRAHVAEIGWGKYVNHGTYAGSTKLALPMEAIQIKLTGTAAQLYDVFYKTHVEDVDWQTDWSKNDAVAGTTGQHLQMEALRVMVVPKGYDRNAAVNDRYKTYAQQTKTVNLNVNASDAVCSKTSISVTRGSTFNNLPTPTRTNYTFDGWFTSASGGTQITPTTMCTDSATITLYARWTKIHNHSYTAAITTQPTCTANGVKTYTCSCGNSYTETVPATGHDYDAVITDPTCETAGFTTYTCKHCPDTYTADETTALGHDIVTDTAVDATCTETGLTAGEHCTRCDYAIAQEVIPVLGHDLVTLKAVEPTCTETGLTAGEYCARCDYAIEQEIVPALGHDLVTLEAVEPTCTETGLTVGEYCNRCDYSVAQTEVPATGHHYDAVVTAPTCTEAGYTTYTCVCGDSYTGKPTAARGHNFDDSISDNVTIIQPTETTDGSKTVKCSRCSKTQVTVIHATDVVGSGECGDNLTWVLTADGTMTISGTGEMWDYEDDLPQYYWHQYYYQDEIKKVVIENGVTSIGECALSGLSTVNEVVIPDSVVEIEEYALCMCENLTKISVDPNNLYYCNDSDGVLFSKDKTVLIQYPSGRLCEEYAVPDGVVEIKEGALAGSGISKVHIPSSVSSIGLCPFGWSLVEFVEVDPENSFFSNDFTGSLYNKDKTELIQFICSWDDERNYEVSRYFIPDGVITIDDDAFDNDIHGLYEIVMPNTVQTIGYAGLPSCADVFYCGSEEEWDQISFDEDLWWYGNVYFNCDDPAYSTKCGENLTWSIDSDGTLIISGTGDMYDYTESDAPWIDYLSYIKALSVSEGVTSIGAYAFCLNDNLLDVNLPDSLEKIGEFAFCRCDGLTSIEIPKNANDVGPYAFGGCLNLKSIKIADGVTTVGAGAFIECDELKSVTIPASVVTIDEAAFFECKQLSDIYYLGNKNDFLAIEIGAYNAPLTNATIHYHTHSYTPVITTPATCTTDGVMTYTCSCGDSYTETIPATGHHYNAVVTAPTCTAAGFTTYTCKNCPDTYTADETAALGHDIVTDAAIEPTCTETGLTAGEHCTRCDYAVTQTVVPATGHHYNAVVTAPTCTVAGYTTYTCKDCPDTYTADETAALGHDFDESISTNVTIVAATGSKDGSKTVKCSRCDEVQTTIIPKTGEVDPNAPQFVVSNVKGNAGQTVSVSVNIANNPGIIAARLYLTYDRDILTLESVTDGGVLGTDSMMAGADLTKVPYTVFWENALSSTNFTENGTLVTFTFRISDNAPLGVTEIAIDYDEGSTIDVNMDDVSFETGNGSVEITNRIPGDANNDGSMNLKDAVLIRRWLAGGWDVTIDEANADVNADGLVNLKDVALIKRYLSDDWDATIV